MAKKWKTFRIHLTPRKRGVRYFPRGSGRKHPVIEINARSKKEARRKISPYPYRIKKIV